MCIPPRNCLLWILPISIPESIEGTGFIVVNQLCCSMLFKGNHSLISIYIHQHSLSPNQCMWSIVVVTAMVASTVTSVWLDDCKPQFFCVFFTKLISWLCSLMGVSRDHRIANSASHHFYKILFLKNKQKKNHCLDMFFLYISQNIYCFKMTSNYSNDIFYFVEYVDLRTMRKVLNSLTLFSIFVLSYWNLTVYLNWMTDVCVCFVRMCVFVSVCWSVCAWVTEMTGCIANWIHPVLQVGKGRVPLLLKKRKSLPVIIWSGVSPLSSCIEPLFLCKEPLPIYSPQTFLCM